MIRTLIAIVLAATACYGSLVSEVRTRARQGDYEMAAGLASSYRRTNGVTPVLALAVSWIGREAVRNDDYTTADRYAAEARGLSLSLLKTRQLDEDKTLPTALGASIEVTAQAMAARGELSEAVTFLNDELETWRATSIRARIQKNIHLLSLEGKPAPPLELGEHIGPKPLPLEELKGKVLLLFFWAHWCPDCKAEAPVLARLRREYSAKELVIIGPSKRYGFAARGEPASADAELAYMDRIRTSSYAAVPEMTVPVSEENFARYGSSSTPTLVLVDRKGIVRLYHPGEMTYEALAPKVAALIGE